MIHPPNYTILLDLGRIWGGGGTERRDLGFQYNLHFITIHKNRFSIPFCNNLKLSRYKAFAIGD
jgi:hypothetical protein